MVASVKEYCSSLACPASGVPLSWTRTPSVMTVRRAPVDVELTGSLTLGMTVTDLRAPAPPDCHTQVAVTLDHARFWGLVVDALLYPHLNDAVKMLDSGYASVEDIDTAMKAGCGYPKGPFELLDEAGYDDVSGVLSEMYFEAGETHLVPSPLLTEHLLAERSFRG